MTVGEVGKRRREFDIRRDLVRSVRGWELRPWEYDRGTQTRRAKVELAFIPSYLCMKRGAGDRTRCLPHAKPIFYPWVIHPALFHVLNVFVCFSVNWVIEYCLFFLSWGYRGRNKTKRWQCFRAKIQSWEPALLSSSHCVWLTRRITWCLTDSKYIVMND